MDRQEAEYDLRITRRAVLQPPLALNTALSDVREHGPGSGVDETATGLGLRPPTMALDGAERYS